MNKRIHLIEEKTVPKPHKFEAPIQQTTFISTMVSQLSSRLLSGYTTSSATSTGSSSNNKAASSRRSGYSADKEQNSASPPILIGLSVKRRKISDQEEKVKRRKMNEAAYAAATVKEDLARVGCLPPPLQLRGILALNPNRVQLVSASSVSASPFLAPTWSSRSDIATDYGSIYMAAIRDTKAAYNAPMGMSFHDSECTSSTSSVSDTDSDDSGNSSPLLVVKARLEDSVKTKPKPQLQYASHFITGTPHTSMTLEDAVGVCDHGRLIVQSGPPYEVIHSNASFGRMTGLKSSQTLGKSLEDIVSSSEKKGVPANGNNTQSARLSLASCAASSSEGQDVTVWIGGNGMQEGDNAQAGASSSPPPLLRCKMRVTPIVSDSVSGRQNNNNNSRDSLLGSDNCGMNNVTHFAIDLIDDATWIDGQNATGIYTTVGPSMVVG